MSNHTLVFHPRTDADWETFRFSGKDRTTLVIPGEHVLVRVMEPAGKTTQQKRAAALAKLGPDLAQDPGECVVGLGRRANGDPLVAIADRQYVADCFAAAHDRGYRIDEIIPDTCLLNPTPDSDYTTVTLGENVLVRGPESCFVAQPELLAALGVAPNPSEASLNGHASCVFRTEQPPDLLPALSLQRAFSSDAQQPRRIAWAMAAALILAIAAPWTNAIRLDMSARAMEREAERIAANALPDASQIRNARAQLSAALMAHTNGRQRIETAAVLLGELTAQPDLAIARLDANTDTPAVTASLTAPNAEAALPLRSNLAARNYAAEQTSSEAPNGLTTIDLTVRANP